MLGTGTLPFQQHTCRHPGSCPTAFPALKRRHLTEQPSRAFPTRPRLCPCRAESQSSAQTAEKAPSLEERDELQEQMEEFLRQQAETESGQVPLEEPADAPVTGTNTVSEEEAAQMCKRITDIVRILRGKRDMSLNEIRLTLAIEDPVAKEKREYLEMTDGVGASRDEIAAALSTVAAGRIPKDRIALRALHQELVDWPFLDNEEDLEKGQSANYAAVTDTGEEKGRALPSRMKRDKNEAAKNLLDLLPDWVGYSALYLLISVPVIITIAFIALLFVSSLK